MISQGGNGFNTIRHKSVRILIYSHDTFGLGHLRRCRTIAHEIVARYDGISVLIISGSPVVASFDFKEGVEFVRIPGITKQQNGSYVSANSLLSLGEVITMRESMIRQTVNHYAPDLFIVDKEPFGLQGEVRRILFALKSRGVITVLGLRDVLDERQALLDEWKKKQIFVDIDTLYDEIWIYGLRAFYQPLEGLPLSQSLYAKTFYTGYLRCHPACLTTEKPVHGLPPYILVMVGGGQDGVDLVELVLNTFNSSCLITYHAIIVFGPFMSSKNRMLCKQKAKKIANVSVIDFHLQVETLIKNAAAIIAMGGYNTFCEVLSFNKRALLYPRISPRAEQLIRCQRADQLNLIKLLDPLRIGIKELEKNILKIEKQARPADQIMIGMLDGLDKISSRIASLLSDRYKICPADGFDQVDLDQVRLHTV